MRNSIDLTTRLSKDEYYLSIAQEVAQRSTCLRRNYGAVVVKNDRIVSTGYNGSPRGCTNCNDDGFCAREKLGIESGKSYELCKSLHAEENAIIFASMDELEGSTLYLAGFDNKTGNVITAVSCTQCMKRILNSGISKVVTLQEDLSIKYTYPPVEWISIINNIGGDYK